MIDFFNGYKKFLFLILFFKEDGFAFRYPMNVFFDEKIDKSILLKEWENYNNKEGLLQLYIHSIFCDTRCNYCDCEALLKINDKDFYSYKSYILKNIEEYGHIVKKNVNSIYFGGGTFNLWSDNDIIDICSSVLNNFSLSDNCVWQVEIHPYYLTDNTLKILKDFGVTNIMLGIQTTSEKVNKYNNRKFNKNKLNKAIDEIINLGFKKVSFDFMYNLPSMTLDDLIDDLDFIYKTGKKLKEKGISINVEINRWDISLKTGFANKFLNKVGTENFFDLCKYYINNSKKSVKIVDKYIYEKFLGLFDTYREEIEERKYKNTAILGVGLSSTSYIPGIIAYEDVNYSNWKNGGYNYFSYKLSEDDNDLSFISDNLRRGIDTKFFNKFINNNEKIRLFYETYKDKFSLKGNDFYLDVSTDIENDLLNLYLIKENILLDTEKKLLNRWEKLGFTSNQLDEYYDLFLDYYYNRNKLYG